MNLDKLFDHAQTLPTIPAVVQELISSFNNEDVTVEDITKLIKTDQVLSAKLLRLANSAYFHVSRTVSTVDDAVLMLGFVTVRTLVISSGLTGGFKNMPGVDLKQFWRYSLHTAVAAKWLAKQTHANADLVFTTSLMHAIGVLVMHNAMPEQTLQIDKIAGPMDPRRLDIERNSLGYDFAAVGAELANRWKFPDVFARSIRAFPSPLEQQEFDPVAAHIHLAAWRARADENHLNKEEFSATFPTEVAAKLGLKANMVLGEMPPLAELSAGLEELVA